MTELASAGPNVFRTVEELSPGETSGVVQQDARLYLVKLWERQPSRPLTLRGGRDPVEQELGDVRVAALQKERERGGAEALKLEVSRSRRTRLPEMKRRGPSGPRLLGRRRAASLLDLEVHQLDRHQDVAGRADHRVAVGHRLDHRRGIQAVVEASTA